MDDSGKKFCQNCGNELTGDEKFCKNCGHAVSNGANTAENTGITTGEKSKNRKKKHKTPLIIGIVVVVILLIQCSNSSDSSSTPKNSGAESEIKTMGTIDEGSGSEEDISMETPAETGLAEAELTDEYYAEGDAAVEDPSLYGEQVDTFGYPIMDYEGYWEDIELLKAVADGAVVTGDSYWYYTIPGYDGLIFYLSNRAVYDAPYEDVGEYPYGVFCVNEDGMIGEVYNEPVELTQSDYENAEIYDEPEELTQSDYDYNSYEKLGWIDTTSYIDTVNRLEEHKKQLEYEESKAAALESRQAALDSGYVPGGSSYEDVARYVNNYIGYKLSWSGGLVTDVKGDMVTVCVGYDNYYGFSTPDYDKSFVLDCSKATSDNGKPLIDDHINFEGTITGTNMFTNHIEVKADFIHPYK